MKARYGIGAPLMLCAMGFTAYAQDVLPPGLVARFDVTQRLQYSDNPDLNVEKDADVFGRTVLGFGLESVTKVERFAFSIDADIDEGRNNRSSFDLTNSFVGLEYDRNTRNALVGLAFNFREADTTSSISDADFLINPDIINQDSGSRRTYFGSLEAAIGREAPIGASFAWTYSESTFSDTSDPDLTDESTNDLSGQIDFRIDPRITASLTAKYIDFDAQGNGVSRETTGFGTAVNLEVTPVTTVDVSLSQDKIERSGDEVGTNEGLSGGFDVTRAVPNGSIGLSYASNVTSNDDGRRSFLSASRELDLPRGALAVSLGVTGADAVGTDPLVDISYRHERSTSLLSFGLSQSVRTNDDNQEQVLTSLRANFDQQINSLSSFGTSIGFFDVDDLDVIGNDSQRVDISLSYRYDLTPDWGLVSGYTYSLSKENNASDRSSNTVFVGLQRSFNWNP
jgi:hypothetical protein